MAPGKTVGQKVAEDPLPASNCMEAKIGINLTLAANAICSGGHPRALAEATVTRCHSLTLADTNSATNLLD